MQMLEELVNRLKCIFCLQSKSEVEQKQKIRKFLRTGKILSNEAQKYNIRTLPVIFGKELTDLYPPSNHVEKWSTLIVGKHKDYILANINDIDIPFASEMLNRKSSDMLPDEINRFFNHVWDNTLSGNELQFFMLFNNRTFFVNTYHLLNGEHQIIGAVMFMRSLDVMTNLITKQERDSIEFMVESSIYKS
jgi:hypothetical protein